MQREPIELFQELCELLEARAMEKIMGRLQGKPPAKAPAKKRPPVVYTKAPQPKRTTIKAGDRDAIESLTHGILKHLGDNKNVPIADIAKALKSNNMELRYPLRKLKDSKLITVKGDRLNALYNLA